MNHRRGINRRRPSILCCLVVPLIVVACAGPSCAAQASTNGRTVRSLDADWRFHLGDAAGAEKVEFDDRDWRIVDVPHDWSIEGEFDRANPAGRAGAFLPAGTGWYRQRFSVPAGSTQRRVVVEFDGVMANSEVSINGQRVGGRPSGYVSFQCDLTDHIKFGESETNVLAVRVDNSNQPASRWYTGSGIYRHVRLTQTDALHLVADGVFVTTPEISGQRAAIHVQMEIVNEADSPRSIEVETQIVDSAGRVVDKIRSNEKLSGDSTAELTQKLKIESPQLWQLDDPELYRAVTRLTEAGRTIDEVTTPFGIRTIEFKADSGFWLNGQNLKIKGVCLHHDGGALGAAVPLAAWERRLKALQALGVNAVRTAHNPPAPEFLDLCDRLGILVMLEHFDCWTKGKTPYDYHLYFDKWAADDVRDTIRRDRNHPSVILYSVGNEIGDTRQAEHAKQILAELVEICHRADPTRPVTQGLFRPNTSHDYDNGLADLLDVIGTNYRDRELLAAWRAKPTRKIIGTEQGHDRNIWLACRDNPQHAGQFLWVGIDYLGESTGWPATTFNAGLLDRTGHPQPRAFERQSWWSDRPMVSIMRRVRATERTPVDPGFENVPWRRRRALLPDWTPVDLGAHRENVEVYSNCEEVELSLNGNSLGALPLPADGSSRNWEVEFAPGVLSAVGRNAGTDVATAELRTAGEPAKIRLTADAKELGSTWDDVAFIEAEIVDEHGIRVPRATNLVQFRLHGPGQIVAVDSGSVTSHERFDSTQRQAFDGRCIAMVRATGAPGTIIVSAESDQLIAGELQIETLPK